MCTWSPLGVAPSLRGYPFTFMISADIESFPDVSHSTVYHILWCTSFPRTLIPVNFLVSLVSDLQYIPHSYQTSVRVATRLALSPSRMRIFEKKEMLF